MKNSYLTTARLTGLFYLGLAITGVFAFLFAKQELFIETDAVATAANFVEQEGLARFGIISEWLLVGFQALAAMWFYKLFRKVDAFAAFSLAAFGIINAVGIMVSNAFWLEAVNLATRGLSVDLVLVMMELHDALWLVSALFFGLWLIPMGYLAILAKMPKTLGWILIIGGVGYIVSTFLSIFMPMTSSSLVEGLAVPATIGEFWMIGYLLTKKVRI